MVAHLFALSLLPLPLLPPLKGVTRERLEGFDRPITLEPDFWGDKRNALIGEFRSYLGILKAVHSGADLQASANAAGNK